MERLLRGRAAGLRAGGTVRHQRGHGGRAFAHTPLGALLAAVNIGVRANAQWGPRIFTAVIRGQVTGPDAAALLAGCQAAYDQAAQSGQ